MSKYLNVSLVKVKLDNSLKKYNAVGGNAFSAFGVFSRLGAASLLKAVAGGTQESDPPSDGTRAWSASLSSSDGDFPLIALNLKLEVS